MMQSTRDNPSRRPWLIFRGLAGWRIGDLGPDIAAGLTLAAIAIPEQMATARLGGFPPVTGFLVFIAGTCGFAVFGASRVISAGADSTIAPIFAGSLALIAATGTTAYAGLAMLLAVMTGAMLVIGGLFRMGWVANLISIPVMTGFLAGIAIHIAVSQLPTLFGIAPGTGTPIVALIAIARELGGTNAYSLALGAGVFAIIFAGEKLKSHLPLALVALVAAALATTALALEQRGVAVIGAVAGGFPGFAMAMPTMDEVIDLIPLSLIIVAVAMVQTAATSRAFVEDRDAVDVSRDFIGVGAGGILSGLFGGFAVNSSPPRTGAVVETGGRSQVSGLVAAAIVAALLIFGTGLLAHIPMTALAGVLLFVAQRLVRGSVFASVWRQSKAEFALIVATLAAIVVLPIETGVGIGIVLSLLHGVWTMARAQPVTFDRIPETTVWWPANPHHPGVQIDGVLVMGFQAPLAFLNAEIFARGAERLIEARPNLALVILEASSVVEIDYTAAQSVTRLMDYCRQRRIDFAVARLESTRAHESFDRFGLRAKLGPDHLFHSVHEALRALYPQGL